MATPPARTDLADTYPNPSNAQFRIGIGKLWDYVTERLGLSGSAADARSALGIGPAISYRNRLRNSRFSINQRAVSGTVTLGVGAYGHDGWKAGASGCTYTFATSAGLTTITITAGSLSQVIEGNDVEGGTYCLSWTGTSTGRLNNSGAYGSSGLTGTLTAGSSAYVEFSTGTLSAVQLEPGSVPTPVERRPYALELSICQRYYQTSYDGVAPGTASAAANRRVVLSTSSTTPGFQFLVGFPVTMRAVPTLTLYNPTTGAVGSARNETAGTDIVVGTFGSPGKDYFAAYNTAVAATNQQIYSLHYTAVAEP